MSTRIFPSSIAANSGRLLTEKSVSNIPRYILDYNSVISGGNWDKTVSDNNTIEIKADLVTEDDTTTMVAPSVYIFDGYQVIVDDPAITVNINNPDSSFGNNQFVVYLRLKYQNAGENSEDFVVNEDFKDDGGSNNPYIILKWPAGDNLLDTVDGSELDDVVGDLTSATVTTDTGYTYKYCPLWVIRYHNSQYDNSISDSNDDYRFLTKIAADKVDLGFFELNTLGNNDGSSETNESVYDQRKVISANGTYKTSEQLLYQYIKWINNTILGNKSLSKNYNAYDSEYRTWQHSYISSSTTGLVVDSSDEILCDTKNDFPNVNNDWGSGDDSITYDNVGIKTQSTSATLTSTAVVGTSTTTFTITLSDNTAIVDDSTFTLTVATSPSKTYTTHNGNIYLSTDTTYTTTCGTIDYTTGSLVLDNSILTISS